MIERLRHNEKPKINHVEKARVLVQKIIQRALKSVEALLQKMHACHRRIIDAKTIANTKDRELDEFKKSLETSGRTIEENHTDILLLQAERDRRRHQIFEMEDAFEKLYASSYKIIEDFAANISVAINKYPPASFPVVGEINESFDNLVKTSMIELATAHGADALYHLNLFYEDLKKLKKE